MSDETTTQWVRAQHHGVLRREFIEEDLYEALDEPTRSAVDAVIDAYQTSWDATVWRHEAEKRTIRSETAVALLLAIRGGTRP